jgi:molybdopterin-biosynthesis enzyme MoeA-like protein
MRIALVIIGDEILDGLREDKNFRIALNILGDINKISTVIFVRDNLEELKNFTVRKRPRRCSYYLGWIGAYAR